jgi:hypothetical protein
VSWKPCPSRKFGQKPEQPEHPEHPEHPEPATCHGNLVSRESLRKSLNSPNILNILKLPRVTFRSMRKFGQKLEHPEHGRRAAKKDHEFVTSLRKNLNTVNTLKLPRVTFLPVRKFRQKLEHPEHTRRVAEKIHLAEFARNLEHPECPEHPECVMETLPFEKVWAKA